jgi:hypothetical protein
MASTILTVVGTGTPVDDPPTDWAELTPPAFPAPIGSDGKASFGVGVKNVGSVPRAGIVPVVTIVDPSQAGLLSVQSVSPTPISLDIPSGTEVQLNFDVS